MSQAIVRQLEQASHRHNAGCHNCTMLDICHPDDAFWTETTTHQELRNYKKGQTIFRDKDNFSHIYCVREGAVKTYKITPDGSEQVIGFYLAGEVFGLDGLSSKQHTIHANTLQETSICRIPFQAFMQQPQRMQNFFEVVSSEISRAQNHIALINRNRAEVRIAALLLDIANRLQDRHQGTLNFELSMSRADMANYLGLTIETISRILRRMELSGVAKLSRKHLEIFDLQALQKQGYF